MKLFYKFFISFAGMLVLVLILNLFSMYVISRNNFTKLAKKVENQKVLELSSQLETGYSIYKNWNFILQNPDNWMHLSSRPRPPHLRGSYKKPPKFPPPRSPYQDFSKRLEKNRDKRPIDPLGIRDRLALFDKNNSYIAGVNSDPENFEKFEIDYKGEIIGWIGVKKMSSNDKPGFLDLFNGLKTAFLFTGLISVFFAGFFALLLSRLLMKPLNEIIEGTSLLKERNFKTRLNIKTNDELGKLAQDFNIMAKTLEEFENQRSQWLSDISHELRTPIAILQGEMEAIIDGIRKVDKESLTALHNEILHLKKLVNDLHDLFLAESGKLHINLIKTEPFDILKSGVKLYSNIYDKKDIKIDLNFPKDTIHILADPQRLHQVFKNLLENTSRYTNSPGRLEIKGFKDGNNLVILWEDSYPGVKTTSLKNIFKRLYREESSRARSKGGSGLGLSICQNIISAHNAEIDAYSSKSGGLGIKLTFPLYEDKDE